MASIFRKKLVYFTPKNPTDIKTIVESLIKSPGNSVILPYIDSPLAEEILSKPFSSLTVCEKDDELRNNFQIYAKKTHPERKIFVRNEDLISSSFQSAYGQDEQVCASIVRQNLGLDFTNLSQRYRSTHSVFDERNIHPQSNILVPLLVRRYETSFVTHLFYQMCLRIGFFQDTFVNYYLLMSHGQHVLLKGQAGGNLNNYRQVSVIPNLIFKIHWLNTFDITECFGLTSKSFNKKDLDSSHQQVHLALLEPNRDLISSLDPPSLLELKFFICQLMAKRRVLVTKFIDRWFGDCRPYPVVLGLTDTTRSGDLNPDDYLRLFLYLKDQPNYRNSTFIDAVLACEPWYKKVTHQLLEAVGCIK